MSESATLRNVAEAETPRTVMNGDEPTHSAEEVSAKIEGDAAETSVTCTSILSNDIQLSAEPAQHHQ